MNWNAPQFWIDGGCQGNHTTGPRRAYGSISDGTNVQRLELGQAHTNNEAEYLILLALLDSISELREVPPTVMTDSRLVYGQLTQGWRVRAPNLRGLQVAAQMRLRDTGAQLVWVPRREIVARLGH